MKRISHHITRPLLTLSLCAAMLSPASAQELTPANAQGQLIKADASQLDALKVSRVQPMAFMDTDSAATVRGSLGAVASLERSDDAMINGLPKLTAPAQASGDQGFGFGGQSGEIDLVSLQYGYILGVLPLLRATSSPEKFQELTAQLDQMAKLHALYTGEVGANAQLLVASAKAGEDNSDAYMNLLQSATRGISQAENVEGERLHGYLLTGMWAGFAQLSTMAGGSNAQVAQIGDGIQHLLMKDASFGGSDQQLAAEVSVISGQLRGDKPDTEAVSRSVQKLLAVGADQKG